MERYSVLAELGIEAVEALAAALVLVVGNLAAAVLRTAAVVAGIEALHAAGFLGDYLKIASHQQ